MRASAAQILTIFGKTWYYEYQRRHCLIQTLLKIVMDGKLRWNPSFVNDIVVDITDLGYISGKI